MGELRTIARHAGTVLAGQLAVIAFGVTDTMVAGQYSSQALAALSVASAIFVSVYISLMGVLQALLPIWAEQHGQQQDARIGQSFRQSLYLAGAAAAIGVAVLLAPGKLLDWAKVPPLMQPEVRTYLRIVAMALPAALFFRLFATLNQSLGHPQLVTWLQMVSLAPKIVLSVWFTWGGAGVPAMGSAGCAWATLLVQYATAILAIYLLRRQPIYKPLKLWRPIEPPDVPLLRHFLRLGIPAGLAIGVEVTSFTLMALFIARQGSLPSASHQIAANVAALCYMLPLSLAIAASARVSYRLGRGHLPEAIHLARTGLKISVLLGSALGLLVWLAREGLARWYSHDTEVVKLASALLQWVALYHLFDSIQCYCVFLLRSLRITMAPLITYCVLLWGIGLGGGYGLAYGLTGLGAWQSTPAPFWIMSVLALALTALIFSIVLLQALRAAKPPASIEPLAP